VCDSWFIIIIYIYIIKVLNLVLPEVMTIEQEWRVPANHRSDFLLEVYYKRSFSNYYQV